MLQHSDYRDLEVLHDSTCTGIAASLMYTDFDEQVIENGENRFEQIGSEKLAQLTGGLTNIEDIEKVQDYTPTRSEVEIKDEDTGELLAECSLNEPITDENEIFSTHGLMDSMDWELHIENNEEAY